MQYNQNERGQAVRVGNWFEELKLKEDTGIRFYASPTNRESSLLTKTRCIVHSAQTDPKDYISVSRETLTDPKTNPGRLVVGKVGPRYQRFEQTVKGDIESTIQRQTAADFQESRRLSYATETTSKLSKPGFQPSLVENDFSIRIPTKTTNYSTDTAVTFYSHAVDKSEGGLGFPMSFVTSMNPFRKNCVFSADNVTEALAVRTETYERPKGLPTVREFKSLMAFRSRLIEHVKGFLRSKYGASVYPGHAVSMIVSVLSKFDDCAEVSISEINQQFSDKLGGFQLSTSERYALTSALDKHAEDAIPAYDVAVIFRRTPAPRRQELINLAYSLLDPVDEGRVNIVSVTDRLYQKNAHAQAFLDYVASPSNEFTREDFSDFYTYVSSEIESDNAFEQLIKDAWGSV